MPDVEGHSRSKINTVSRCYFVNTEQCTAWSSIGPIQYTVYTTFTVGAWNQHKHSVPLYWDCIMFCLPLLLREPQPEWHVSLPSGPARPTPHASAVENSAAPRNSPETGDRSQGDNGPNGAQCPPPHVGITQKCGSINKFESSHSPEFVRGGMKLDRDATWNRHCFLSLDIT